MYYAQARYYNPTAGRFAAEDPIKDQHNWYGYCNSNPLAFVDPAGLFATNPGFGWNEPADHMFHINSAVAASGGSVSWDATTGLINKSIFGVDVGFRLGNGVIIQNGQLYITAHTFYSGVVAAADPSKIIKIAVEYIKVAGQWVAAETKKAAVAIGNFFARGWQSFQNLAARQEKWIMNQLQSLFGSNVAPFSLSTNEIKHISNRHIPSVFANQVPHMSNSQLTHALNNRTFFNPEWTQAQVVNAVEQGVNFLRGANLATGTQSIIIGGEQITIAFDINGVFKTAYGIYRLTAEFFGR